MSETQSRILKVLVEHKQAVGGILSADEIGRRTSPRIGRLGVTSALRALERKGLVHRLPPRDQWAVAKWAPNDAGCAAVANPAS